MADPIVIVFPIFDQVTQLDFTGPHQFLCRLPGAKVIVASARGGEVRAEGGVVFARTTPLATVERCDLICVPGGYGATTAALDPDYLPHVRQLAEGARYVTSVCTGALILGATGLLKGKRAACHWQWRHLLPLYGAIPDAGRVVRDGHIITGGGVTAGIDFALTMVAEIAGEDYAKRLQLGLEYAPAPPFDTGSPETAPAELVERLNAISRPWIESRTREAEQAAAALSL